MPIGILAERTSLAHPLLEKRLQIPIKAHHVCTAAVVAAVVFGGGSTFVSVEI